MWVTQPKTKTDAALQRLGSKYGGWFIDTNAEPEKCFLVSAGLGEDASFDIEYVDKYGLFAILIDPTPRAVQHFQAIIGNAGSPKLSPYNNSGKQLIDSYELRRLNRFNFYLREVALWTKSGQVAFHEPENQTYVSHSIKKSNSRGSSIRVNAACLKDILLEFEERIVGLEMVLKLDIEGSEIEVLKNILSSGIKPRQILVEWDFLRSCQFREFLQFLILNFKLRTLGYVFSHRENLNTLLVRSVKA